MNLTEILEALGCGNDKKTHEHSLLFESGKNKWQQIRYSELFRDYLAEIREATERFLASPTKALRFSAYRKFDETGSREEYQREYFERRARLSSFAVMCLVYEEDVYKEALEDIIWAICDEYTWCLPAHLQGKSLEIPGTVHSFYRTHDKQIDLFNAETGFALAEILYLTKDKLAPLITSRAKQLIVERVLEPFCEINQIFDWETASHNWAAVCGGSVGAAAIYLIDDDKALAPIIRRVLDTMDCFLNGYHEDGVCTEGITYWTYGFGFFTYFAELLRQKTAGKIDIMLNEKVRRIAVFQQNAYLTQNMTVSFSDSPLYTNFRFGLTCYLKNRFDEVEIPDTRYKAGFNDDHCYRWAHIIRDLVWGRNEADIKGLVRNSGYMEQSQWLVARTAINGKAVCLAAKGGHNDEPHNHNDVGSFIFHVNGETLLTDLGAGEYTKQYFGPRRYSILNNSSRGHSVPVVDGEYQKEGVEFRAVCVKCSIDEERDLFSMDISKAYGIDCLNVLFRSFEFKKGSKDVLTIEDTYSFKSKPKAIVERFVSLAKPEQLESGKVILKGNSESVIISYDPSLCCFRPGFEDYSDHYTAKKTAYFLDFDVKKDALRQDVIIRFEFTVS